MQAGLQSRLRPPCGDLEDEFVAPAQVAPAQVVVRAVRGRAAARGRRDVFSYMGPRGSAPRARVDLAHVLGRRRG